jgi:8-oxo-dGTP diphosphatase
MINCEFEDGGKSSLRHAVVDTIVIKEGKVLLVKRGAFSGKPILESGKWALIGGFMERDETIKETAAREIMEETGWEIENLKLFRIIDDPNRPAEDRQNIAFIVIAEAKQKNEAISEEVQEIKWFDLDKLPSRDQLAFDHADSLELYKKYLKKKFDLPLTSF